MLVSLVLATKDRTAELERFLQNLARSTYSDYELIVVDQNPDDRLGPILTAHPGMNISHLKSEVGASRGRNVGISAASGEVIGFPDDDCWYAEDVLQTVVSYLQNQPAWGGISGRTLSEQQGLRPLWKWDRQQGPVTKRNVWKRVTCTSIFLRQSKFGGMLTFDERLGVGAQTPWGSAEEVDLILRALSAGTRIEFLPDLVVYHKNAIPQGDPSEIDKTYRYACGMGFVLRRHRYAPDLIALEVMRPLINIVRALVLGDSYKAKLMTAMARGRIRGLLGSG